MTESLNKSIYGILLISHYQKIINIQYLHTDIMTLSISCSVAIFRNISYHKEQVCIIYHVFICPVIAFLIILVRYDFNAVSLSMKIEKSVTEFLYPVCRLLLIWHNNVQFDVVVHTKSRNYLRTPQRYSVLAVHPKPIISPTVKLPYLFKEFSLDFGIWRFFFIFADKNQFLTS